MPDIFAQWDFVGGIIVYFIVEGLKSILKEYILKEYQDPVFLGIAIILSVIYGLITKSVIQGLQAFAGAQIIHALIKKGILFKKS
jgi:hypothetical protein